MAPNRSRSTDEPSDNIITRLELGFKAPKNLKERTVKIASKFIYNDLTGLRSSVYYYYRLWCKSIHYYLKRAFNNSKNLNGKA